MLLIWYCLSKLQYHFFSVQSVQYSSL